MTERPDVLQSNHQNAPASSGEQPFETELKRIRQMIRAGDPASAWRDLQCLPGSFENRYEYRQVAGVAALQAGNLLDAQASFEVALNLAQNSAHKATAAAGLCEVLLSTGQPEAAEQQAQHALSLHPRNLDYHQLLARCYSAQGQVERAVEFLKTSMASMPPKVRFAFQLQIADILTQASHAREALTFIDAVERDQPGNIDVLARKAAALELQGQLSEAADYYMRLLKIAPTLPVYTRLAKLKADDGDESLIPLLEDRLAHCAQSNLTLLTNLHFALAQAYDNRHDYDIAFSHLQLANKLKRSTITFNLGRQRESFARIAAFFNRAMIVRLSNATHATEGPTPIFIFGMPRSGTTLVEQILSAHSEVFGNGELPFMDQITTELGRKWEALGSVMPDDVQLYADFEQAARRYRELIAGYANGARYVTDKMPLNFRHLGLIRLLFPGALLIHCQRDSRDICLSCYQQLFNSNNLSFAYDLAELGGFYRLYREYMAHWASALGPGAWLDIEYESLVAGINSKVLELLNYCNLKFEPECVKFHKSGRTVLTASSIQVRRPLYSDSIGKWRHYEAHLAPLIDALHGKGQFQ